MNETPIPVVSASTAAPAPAAAPATLNPAWWRFSERGSVDGVQEAIDASPKIPDRWKPAVKAEIEASCAGFNFVWVDAHYFVRAGKGNLHLTVEPDRVL